MNYLLKIRTSGDRTSGGPPVLKELSTFFHLPCLAFDKVYSLQPQKQDLTFLYNKPLNFPRLQLQCANCGDTGYNLRSGRKKTRIFLKIMINYNHVKGNVFSKRNARTFCQNMHQDFFKCFCKLVLKCKVCS